VEEGVFEVLALNVTDTEALQECEMLALIVIDPEALLECVAEALNETVGEMLGLAEDDPEALLDCVAVALTETGGETLGLPEEDPEALLDSVWVVVVVGEPVGVRVGDGVIESDAPGDFVCVGVPVPVGVTVIVQDGVREQVGGVVVPGEGQQGHGTQKVLPADGLFVQAAQGVQERARVALE